MGSLFEVKQVDMEFYEKNIRDFLPEKVIDIHTHVWLEKFRNAGEKAPVRTVTWPSLVAKDNSVEDLIETYRLMFPGKQIIPVIFGFPDVEFNIDRVNEYIGECAAKYHFPSLLLTKPEWSAGQLEEQITGGGFQGCKVYLSFAPKYIPEKEIRIFDFLPHHQLEVLDAYGLVVILHIPRDGRLKDPVNLAQMLEIERRYSNVRLIIAHVGRAYCNEDLGNAFEMLAETRNMMFDFSANTNQWIFEQLIKAVGPKRILFGSDLPILRMRTRRICEHGNYVNIIPNGLYGDVSGDRHMREAEGKDASNLTFFMYEEIDAFRRAAESACLTRDDIGDIFYNNAIMLLHKAF